MILQDLLFTINADGINGLYLCTNNETFPEGFRFNCEYFTSVFYKLRKAERDDILQKKVKKLSMDRNRDISENPHFIATSSEHNFRCPIYPIDVFLEE